MMDSQQIVNNWYPVKPFDGEYVTFINRSNFGEDMSNRESWEFTFAGAELLEAVKGQLASIKLSLVQTKKEIDETKKTIQKQGIEFDGSNVSSAADRRITYKLQGLEYKYNVDLKRQYDLHRWRELLSKTDAGYAEYQLLFHDHAFFFPNGEEHHVVKVKKATKPVVSKAQGKEKAPKKPVVVKPLTEKEMKALGEPTPSPKKEPSATKPKVIEVVKVVKTT